MEQAALIYALYLGIDLDKEKDLITIAKQALQTLPSNWQLGFGDDDSEHPGVPYFYNTFTEESRWTHPKEAVYFDMVVKERAKSNTSQNDSGTSMARGIVNKSLHVEEFEEWDTNQSGNVVLLDEQDKISLNEDGFEVDREHASLRGNIASRTPQGRRIFNVNSSDHSNSMIIAKKYTSNGHNTGTKEDLIIYGGREYDNSRSERDKYLSNVNFNEKIEPKMALLTEDHEQIEKNRHRKKEHVRKPRYSEKQAHNNDLMKDLQYLSSLNINLEREIKEVQYEGTYIFNENYL